MSQEVDQVRVHPNTNGNLGVQEVAMLGAMMAGTGLETLEVQGLLAEIQRVTLQTSINSMSAVLQKMTDVQRARMINITSQITQLPTVAGYVNKLQVLQIIANVLSSPPRQ